MFQRLRAIFRSAPFLSGLRYAVLSVKVGVLSLFVLSILSTLLLSFVPVNRTPLMLKRHLQSHGEIPIQHTWVPIERISPHLIQAVVASEDNNFTSHFGIDRGAIQKARDFNKKSTKRKHGASTISQQTAKNVFLWPARTYLRKGFELYFTLLIETCWSKKRIMEVYLNSIEMGPGIYGAEAAAQHYFRKPASKLTREQAALIAVSLPNP